MAKIEQGMDFDDWCKAWFEVAHDRGHQLKLDDDGGIDQFVTSGGHCNGPGCINCNWSACMHCDFDGSRIPLCSGVRP